MTYSEKLEAVHQQSLDKQKAFVEVVAAIRNAHPDVPDEMYHRRDSLYKAFTRDIEYFKRLARYLEEHRISIQAEFDEGLDIR